METMLLAEASDRRKHPQLKPYRYMTLEEALKLTPGDRVSFRDNVGQVRYVTVNGKVRTWKRTPDRVEVHAKYGLYQYAMFYHRSGVITTGSATLVVPCEVTQ